MITGYLLVDKPKDITSFQCISHLKRIINQKMKIGHAGTLDPFATGLLIICLGREATKTMGTLLDLDKTYLVKAKLGELTDTLDYTGELLETRDANNITRKDLELAIKELGSEYEQVPPIYSALKHKGKPLHELARKNKLDKAELERIVQVKKRTVKLFDLRLLGDRPPEAKLPFFTFHAHVSKGTYIRSLANDIAQKAGNIATTYELKRTKIGHIPLEKAIQLDKLTSMQAIENNLLSHEEFLHLLNK